jgi:hypothetical protein
MSDEVKRDYLAIREDPGRLLANGRRHQTKRAPDNKKAKTSCGISNKPSVILT